VPGHKGMVAPMSDQLELVLFEAVEADSVAVDFHGEVWSLKCLPFDSAQGKK